MIEQIAPNIRQEIEARLATIEATEGVRYLLAVESGSRAWGFPSPDSDYDVRFVYVRSRDWYLRLEPGRDVIETPIEGDIDLNGWDIRKTLGLMLKSNAVVSEWPSSPIRYRDDDPEAARIAALTDEIFDPRGVAHHYANIGRNAADRWLEGDDAVPVKRYFYALRPALAIRALRNDPDRRPSMNLQALMRESAISAPIVDMIEELVEAKRQTRELGNTRRFPELDVLIREELGQAAELPERKPPATALEAANAIFLDLLRE
ncbi:MAG: nucleotidyltransferase domain-containing protein [Pseudomonadota bacterium]